METYSDLILRLSYTYLGSTHDAQDICQDIFLKLLQHPKTFDSPEHERSWDHPALPPTCARIT